VQVGEPSSALAVDPQLREFLPVRSEVRVLVDRLLTKDAMTSRSTSAGSENSSLRRNSLDAWMSAMVAAIANMD
jgi:hypothetical protein